MGEVLDAEGVVDGSRCVAAATTGPFVYAMIFDAEAIAEAHTMCFGFDDLRDPCRGPKRFRRCHPVVARKRRRPATFWDAFSVLGSCTFFRTVRDWAADE